METAHDAYRHMLRDELGPRLRALGFTSPDDTTTANDTPDFRLPIPGHHALIGPHEYWANNPASFQFTINVLVTSHTAWQTFRAAWQTFRAAGNDFQGNPWPEEPATSTHYGPTGPWTTRLGQLMGLGDKWWYISPRRPTEPVADEITTAVQHFALPAITQHTHA